MIWSLIGTAVTFVLVLLVALVRPSRNRLASAASAEEASPQDDTEPLSRPRPEPALAAPESGVADTHSLEALALSVGHELASLASSVEGHAQLLCEGHAQLLCERSGTAGQVIKAADRLWESVRRLRLFSEKLQAFARVEQVTLRPARVTPVLRALVHEIEDYAGGSLEVSLRAAPSLPMALADTRGLRRALLFLIESVLTLEPNTPSITISAQTELNEDMDAEILIEIEAETEELVEAGAPSTADIRFSYVAARNLLEAQGAWVSLTRRPGLSAVASVSLKTTTSSKVALEAAGPETARREPAMPALAAARDGGTRPPPAEARETHQFGGILILDRNPGIREMLTNELCRLGRHVIACDEGRAAEALYSATPERFELLILEQDARRLSGGELAAMALATRRDVRVVLLTSKAKRDAEIVPAPDPRCMQIPKPFGLMELRSVVLELLGTGPGPATIAAATAGNLAR